MAKVDFNSLDYDILIGRKSRVCGRCNRLMAVTTECPKRANSDNKFVCWHCCLKCSYAIKVPGGSQCSIKANKRKAEQEQRQRAKAEKKKKKHLPPTLMSAAACLTDNRIQKTSRQHLKTLTAFP